MYNLSNSSHASEAIMFIAFSSLSDLDVSSSSCFFLDSSSSSSVFAVTKACDGGICQHPLLPDPEVASAVEHRNLYLFLHLVSRHHKIHRL
ncbi:hypothetical protein Bca4012_044008 [Brassica carinata]|uniref:Uncharacterized protein n=1 Tax=Brassica carinata TaxID=52824 RepID=A0A8X7QSQ6_BRACI|nr:hypothetical protein Bca52824_058413 [Brassica carinata]